MACRMVPIMSANPLPRSSPSARVLGRREGGFAMHLPARDQGSRQRWPTLSRGLLTVRTRAHPGRFGTPGPMPGSRAWPRAIACHRWPGGPCEVRPGCRSLFC